jgi:Protein of unknown function DUF262/Protein of unknown function (DUF1524)
MQIGILSPELKSIEQLFAGNARFSVPRYQRSFAWTADETEELWEDLFGAVKRSGEYFLGTIVLQRKDSEAQAIIDGQQRLACITMLFSAIRNVFLAARDLRAQQIELAFLGSKGFNRDAALTPKLALNKNNNETFVQYVLKSQDSTAVDFSLKKKDVHPSNRLLLEAYRYFLGKVAQEAASKGTKADEFLVPLIDTLRTKLKLITIPVATDEDANLFFESLNARGKELAISDLVKNRLYFEAGTQVGRAERLWEQMEKDLARRPVPEFIRHYWIAKKAAKDSPNVREKNLYRMVANAIKGNENEALALVQDLGKSAPDYARISDYSLWPDDSAYGDSFAEILADLRLFRVTQMNPLLLNAIEHFSTATDIAKTFRIVSNFAFRYFIIGNQSPGNMERVSANIACDIRANTYTSPKDVADALRGVNSDPTFRSDFALASLEGRKRIARYALAKISNHLAKESSQSGAEQIANPDSREVNLEHVLPQDLPTGWRAAFSSGVNPADYVDRIGNLTLLKAKLNREAADKSFEDKKKIALDVSSLKINDYFRGVSKWGDQQIEQRQDGLAKAAIEVWKL